jgi:predicted SnoaL-like aldol condensation-catalyzing enzyme
MTDQREQNKQNVMAFYDLMFNQCQPGIDSFRLDDHGKIVEHWAVHRTIPMQPANTNTMF